MSGLTTEPSPRDQALADAEVITENAYASDVGDNFAPVHSYTTDITNHVIDAGMPGNVVLKLAEEHVESHRPSGANRVVEVDIEPR